jgi:hypothetical protein
VGADGTEWERRPTGEVHGPTAPWLQQQFEQRLRNQEANTSFRLAHRDYGELFEHAYANMIGRAERGDPSVVRQVMASPDPGEAMVRWFKRELTLSKVGDDPDAWFNAQLDERLKDQQFAGSLLTKMRGQAPAASSGAPHVQLPPSLNSVAASAPVAHAVPQMNDAEIFNDAFRKDRRR